MYKAIGFDLGGVILYYSIPFQLWTISRRLGVSHERIVESFRVLRPQLEVGDIDNAEFWRQLIQLSGSTADPAATESVWNENYIADNPFIPGMLDLVDSLRSRNYGVGLMSNTDAEHAHINYGRGIFTHFDAVCLSNEMQLRKPQRQAYEELAKRLEVDIAELVFIDDNPENVAGADRAGAKGVQFEGKDKLVKQLASLGFTV